MKVTGIRVDNILGLRYANIAVTTPVMFVCGHNFQGKSSMQEAIRLALTGETVRVELKKEYAEMVSDGAKEGLALVTTDTGTARMEMPKAVHTIEGIDVASTLPYVLDAQRFAHLKEDDRREFLFKLTGCGIEASDIRRRLTDKGANPEKIEAIVPILLAAKNAAGKRAGFPEACAQAAARATEAKGAWRQITGETYGAQKGKLWKAVVPEFDPAALDAANADVARIENELADVNKELGSHGAKIQQQHQRDQELAQLATKIASLPRLRDKLAVDRKSLADAEAAYSRALERSGKGPRNGLVHDMAVFLADADIADLEQAARAAELVSAYEKQYGPISAIGAEDLDSNRGEAERARNLYNSSVNNDLRDIATAEAAEARHAELSALPRIAESDEDLTARRRTLREQLDAAKKEQDKLQQQVNAASNAQTKTDKAQQAHTEVEQWTKIADALDADGIPAELLAQALKPMNQHLRNSSIVTEWAQVTIEPNMTIKANGRRYSLLSESEKWRADAMIAAAIAELSGTKLLILDRVDVLDLPSRTDLIVWLDQMAAQGKIDTSLIFGTMKARPKGLPPTIEAVWLENGEVTNVRETAEA